MPNKLAKPPLVEEQGAGFGDVELPENVSPDLYRGVVDAVAFPFKIAILLIVAGVLLMLAGLTGAVTFGLSGNGLSLQAQNASPGLVLAMLGVALAALYRPNIRIKTGSQGK
jgi:hypothetical protein